MKSVVVGKGVKSIDEGAFSGCSELEEIFLPSNEGPVAGIAVFSDVSTYVTASTPSADVRTYRL